MDDDYGRPWLAFCLLYRLRCFRLRFSSLLIYARYQQRSV